MKLRDSLIAMALGTVVLGTSSGAMARDRDYDRCGNCASRLRSSSESPSEKYS